MSTIINATTTNGVVIQPDNSGSLVLQTNSGTTALTIDTSQNVGIGTTATQNAERLAVWTVSGSGIKQATVINNAYAYGSGLGTAASALTFTRSNASVFLPMSQIVSGNESELTSELGYMAFYTTNTTQQERMRINSSGNVLIGLTSSNFGTAPKIETRVADGRAIGISNSGTGTATAGIFLNNSNASVGSITYTTTATAYNTSSDYRLKENIAPMTGALATVQALKPVTYKWKYNGSNGQGFIAHELAKVVPDCVTGEKDAIDTEGNPEYQGVDTSFLVATLTAAIQEQQTIINDLKARIETLEAK
jgi:hypothetical protein